MKTVFAERLEQVDLQQIKEWYNGYCWLGESVYNPLDILLYLTEKQFEPYWFETGTPTFLIKMLIDKRLPLSEMKNPPAVGRLLDSFDVGFIQPENLLFQKEQNPLSHLS